MKVKKRLAELLLLLSVIALLFHRSGGALTIDGVAPGMTAAQVEEQRKIRKDRAWVEWGSDDRVSQAEGNSLERGGHPILAGHGSVAEVRAALGKGDQERLTALSDPGEKRYAAVLLYKRERLEVEVSPSGELHFKLF